MIEEIVIRDLGVISEARLKLGPGFTALTGETGAGKTMILTALGLLLGERSDSAAVRRGHRAAGGLRRRRLLPIAARSARLLMVRSFASIRRRMRPSRSASP